MITFAGKSLAALTLLSAGSGNYSKALIQIANANGVTKYMGNKFSLGFPYSTAYTVQTGKYAGIVIGSGSDSATANDYWLKNQITSGFTASTPSAAVVFDENDNPVMNLSFTITNTSSASLTINEIGYCVNASYGDTKGASPLGSSTTQILIDRTVLDTPITIPAGENAAIIYKIKANIFT